MGARVMRAYGSGPHIDRDEGDRAAPRRSARVRAGSIAAFLFPSGELFSVLTIAAVLVVGCGSARFAG